jgi:hypothetical protein
MNKFILLVASLFVFAPAEAQTVVVKMQSDNVKGENMEGYATEVQGKKTDVNTTLTKILKDHGKIKFLSSDPTVVTNPMLDGALYEKGILFATLKESSSVVTIWIGRKVSDWQGTDAETINKQVEKLVYQTGIQFYRDQVQMQIDQTQQAADAVAKQISRTISQSQDLVKKLENNGQEKIRLENSIELNKLENAVLKVKIENNKKAQDSLVSATAKIQQMKQVHEERLRKIN